MERYNTVAIKVLFFSMLTDLKVADSPWHSRMEPKLLYELEETETFWDVPAYAKHTSVRANGVEARFVYHKTLRVLTNTTIAITESHKKR